MPDDQPDASEFLITYTNYKYATLKVTKQVTEGSQIGNGRFNFDLKFSDGSSVDYAEYSFTTDKGGLVDDNDQTKGFWLMDGGTATIGKLRQDPEYMVVETRSTGNNDKFYTIVTKDGGTPEYFFSTDNPEATQTFTSSDLEEEITMENVRPAYIKLTKLIDRWTAGDLDTEFTFTVNLVDTNWYQRSAPYKETDSVTWYDPEKLTGSVVSFPVRLKHDESVMICAPQNTTYNIYEDPNPYYLFDNRTYYGRFTIDYTTGSNYPGTQLNPQTNHVTNYPVSYLKVKKDLVSTDDDGKSFTFTVRFTDGDIPYSGQLYRKGPGDNGNYTVINRSDIEDGAYTFTLQGGEEIYFKGPKGWKYTVTEAANGDYLTQYETVEDGNTVWKDVTATAFPTGTMSGQDEADANLAHFKNTRYVELDVEKSPAPGSDFGDKQFNFALYIDEGATDPDWQPVTDPAPVFDFNKDANDAPLGATTGPNTFRLNVGGTAKISHLLHGEKYRVVETQDTTDGGRFYTFVTEGTTLKQEDGVPIVTENGAAIGDAAFNDAALTKNITMENFRPAYIRLQKNVYGTQIDPDDEFTFQVQLFTDDDRAAAHRYAESWYSIDGTAGITDSEGYVLVNNSRDIVLSHGEFALICAPEGVYYTITETGDYTDYLKEPAVLGSFTIDDNAAETGRSDKPVVVTATNYPKAQIKVSKVLNAPSYCDDDEFYFMVTFTDPDTNNPYTGQYTIEYTLPAGETTTQQDGTYWVNNEGRLFFMLKKGWTAAITGPAGWNYTIAEDMISSSGGSTAGQRDQNNYFTGITLAPGGSQTPEKDTKSVSGQLSTQGETITATFTNSLYVPLQVTKKTIGYTSNIYTFTLSRVGGDLSSEERKYTNSVTPLIEQTLPADNSFTLQFAKTDSGNPPIRISYQTATFNKLLYGHSYTVTETVPDGAKPAYEVKKTYWTGTATEEITGSETPGGAATVNYNEDAGNSNRPIIRNDVTFFNYNPAYIRLEKKAFGGTGGPFKFTVQLFNDSPTGRTPYANDWCSVDGDDYLTDDNGYVQIDDSQGGLTNAITLGRDQGVTIGAANGVTYEITETDRAGYLGEAFSTTGSFSRTEADATNNPITVNNYAKARFDVTKELVGPPDEEVPPFTFTGKFYKPAADGNPEEVYVGQYAIRYDDTLPANTEFKPTNPDGTFEFYIEYGDEQYKPARIYGPHGWNYRITETSVGLPNVDVGDYLTEILSDDAALDAADPKTAVSNSPLDSEAQPKVTFKNTRYVELAVSKTAKGGSTDTYSFKLTGATTDDELRYKKNTDQVYTEATDGVFTLNGGDTALFDRLLYGKTYTVTETPVTDTETTVKVTTNVDTTGTPAVGTDGNVSFEDDVTSGEIDFTNYKAQYIALKKVDQSNSGKPFAFEVTLTNDDNEPPSWYYLKNGDGTETIADPATNKVTVTLTDGQVAIIGVPADETVSYTIVETNDGYVNTITRPDAEGIVTNAASGSFGLPKDEADDDANIITATNYESGPESVLHLNKTVGNLAIDTIDTTDFTFDVTLKTADEGDYFFGQYEQLINDSQRAPLPWSGEGYSAGRTTGEGKLPTITLKSGQYAHIKGPEGFEYVIAETKNELYHIDSLTKSNEDADENNTVVFDNRRIGIIKVTKASVTPETTADFTFTATLTDADGVYTGWREVYIGDARQDSLSGETGEGSIEFLLSQGKVATIYADLGVDCSFTEEEADSGSYYAWVTYGDPDNGQWYVPDDPPARSLEDIETLPDDIPTISFTNRKKATLEITKKLVAPEGDMDDVFAFTVTLTDKGEAYYGPCTVSGASFEQTDTGVIEFELGADDTATITAPDGVGFKVVETESDEYNTQITPAFTPGTIPETDPDHDNPRAVAGTFDAEVEAGLKVEYKNTRYTELEVFKAVAPGSEQYYTDKEFIFRLYHGETPLGGAEYTIWEDGEQINDETYETSKEPDEVGFFTLSDGQSAKFEKLLYNEAYSVTETPDGDTYSFFTIVTVDGDVVGTTADGVFVPKVPNYEGGVTFSNDNMSRTIKMENFRPAYIELEKLIDGWADGDTSPEFKFEVSLKNPASQNDDDYVGWYQIGDKKKAIAANEKIVVTLGHGEKAEICAPEGVRYTIEEVANSEQTDGYLFGVIDGATGAFAIDANNKDDSGNSLGTKDNPLPIPVVNYPEAELKVSKTVNSSAPDDDTFIFKVEFKDEANAPYKGQYYLEVKNSTTGEHISGSATVPLVTTDGTIPPIALKNNQTAFIKGPANWNYTVIEDSVTCVHTDPEHTLDDFVTDIKGGGTRDTTAEKPTVNGPMATAGGTVTVGFENTLYTTLTVVKKHIGFTDPAKVYIFTLYGGADENSMDPVGGMEYSLTGEQGPLYTGSGTAPDLPEGQFRMTADKTATFSKLRYGYYYKVVDELEAGIKATVKVNDGNEQAKADSGSVQMGAEPSGILFTNYNTAYVKLAKAVDGDTPQNPFNFNVYLYTENDPDNAYEGWYSIKIGEGDEQQGITADGNVMYQGGINIPLNKGDYAMIGALKNVGYAITEVKDEGYLGTFAESGTLTLTEEQAELTDNVLTVTNYPRAKLEVTKRVKRPTASDDTFGFTVAIHEKGDGTKPYKGQYYLKVVDENGDEQGQTEDPGVTVNGSITFSLKKDWKAEIDVPSGWDYTVAEQSQDDFTTDISTQVGEADATIQYNTSSSSTLTADAANDVTMEFTNTLHTTLEVSKTANGFEPNQSFNFQLVRTSSNNELSLAERTYTIDDVSYETSTDGVFTLENGETATFSTLLYDSIYTVTEIDIPDDTVTTVEATTNVDTTGTPDVGTVGRVSFTNDVITGEIDFVNYAANYIKLTKAVVGNDTTRQFTFEVTLKTAGGDFYGDWYYLKKTDSQGNVTENVGAADASNGRIADFTLKHGETAIIGAPSGVTYSIVENLTDLDYENKFSDTDDATSDGGRTGAFKAGLASCNAITVTNYPNVNNSILRVSKIVGNYPESDDLFSFDITMELPKGTAYANGQYQLAYATGDDEPNWDTAHQLTTNSAGKVFDENNKKISLASGQSAYIKGPEGFSYTVIEDVHPSGLYHIAENLRAVSGTLDGSAGSDEANFDNRRIGVIQVTKEDVSPETEGDFTFTATLTVDNAPYTSWYEVWIDGEKQTNMTVESSKTGVISGIRLAKNGVATIYADFGVTCAITEAEAEAGGDYFAWVSDGTSAGWYNTDTPPSATLEQTEETLENAPMISFANLEKAQLTISKTLVAPSANEDDVFTFVVELYGDYADIPFEIDHPEYLDTEQEPDGNGYYHTGETRSLTLKMKGGQTATIKAPYGLDFSVVETQVNSDADKLGDYYTQIEQNEDIWQGTGTESSLESEPQTIAFTNTLLSRLKISKTVQGRLPGDDGIFSFVVEQSIEPNGDEYAPLAGVPYVVYDDDDRQVDEAYTGEDGLIRLRDGQYAIIQGLLYSHNYNVNEKLELSQELYHVVITGSGRQGEDPTLYSGTVGDDTDSEDNQSVNQANYVNQGYTILEIEKIVQGGNGMFTFEIKVGGEPYEASYYIKDATGDQVGEGSTDENGRFKLSNGQIAVFSDIIYGRQYEVNEVNLPAHYVLVSKENDSGTAGERAELTEEYDLPVNPRAVFTNTYVPPRGSIVVEKQVAGGVALDEEREFDFTCTMTFPGGAAYNGECLIDNKYVTPENGVVKFTLKHNQKVTISALSGTLYTVAEAETPGYTTVYEGKVTGAFPDDYATADPIVVVNSPLTGKLTISKRVSNGDTSKSFDFTVTLTDGNKPYANQPWQDGDTGAIANTDELGRIQFSLSHSQQKTIVAPAGLDYLVVEEVRSDYHAYYTNQRGKLADGKEVKADVTNTPISDIKILTITKKWSDDSDRRKQRPERITVRVFQNGKLFRTVELTRADHRKSTNEWELVIDDLPARDEDGDDYKYTIRENSLTRYTTTIKGHTITNTYKDGSVSSGDDTGDSSRTHGRSSPGTGDDQPLEIYLALAALCALLSGVSLYKMRAKRRRRR